MASEVSIVRQFLKLRKIQEDAEPYSQLVFPIGRHIYSKLDKINLIITDGFIFSPYMLSFLNGTLTDYHGLSIDNIDQDDFKNETDAFLVLKYGRNILNDNIILSLNKTDSWGYSNLDSFKEFLSL